MYKILFLFVTLVSLSSCCYRMPTDDDYCMIPSTNNPDLTHQRQEAMPGVGY